MHPFTAFRANGMYEIEYQAKAKNWIMTNRMHSAPLFHAIAATKVRMMEICKNNKKQT